MAPCRFACDRAHILKSERLATRRKAPSGDEFRADFQWQVAVQLALGVGLVAVLKLRQWV